ncbi:PP2C family protein-serine/threonine phosphatase [Geothrix sp. 21YS21S-2]|uniref:PP2C family protein-serine/threonine phosphatase n=1 Tax=Geothrix sp. 21YS21S-2 TaxID=3068893 RepID=UPI0027B8B531|nr:PP2C family protein-serine/threonine phosphatase [Geothrix sp. 21YS21S-2]
MTDPAGFPPFERLRELCTRIPEGTQELLPIIDFLETFPAQATEEDLIHLVGVTALGIAKAPQGGIWNGTRWIFLRGNASPFPTHPGPGWTSLPWAYGEEPYGFLVVRTPEVPAALTLLLSISAPLLAWRRLEANRSDQNRALALQLSRLNTLFDLTRNLGEVETRGELIRLMANTLAGEFHIQRLLVVGADGTVIHSRGLGKLPPVLEGESINGLVEEKGLVHAVELRDQDHSHGFAYAAEPAQGKLNDDDELFFQTLLNITSTQLGSLELRETRLQAMKLEKDLELARNIQRRILPKRLPEPEGWQCAAANLPYQAVGGDLYDLWMASDLDRSPRLHLALADISGKGLPASLMMTQLSAFLRAMADRRVVDWGALALRLNERMNEVRDRNRFATLFMGSLNPATGDLRYVNAGHNPPLLVPGDGRPLEHLQPTGPMVGLLPGAVFSEGRATMHPGDTLVIFTDGVSEAENLAGEDLGEEPLVATVLENPGASADELFERLLTRTFKHLDGAGFKDDVTLVVIKRL